ncbi:DUF6461 domain-containing protein [Ktedonospora formicarum]|uniref:HEAT repeat domain-containing protein n=1 Tax=Ktedonospora formicarum TaxID=2778364 RepID=A0A8J3MN35_9CHLR|nr:DUF6461 domain-containing protein [Ktedonospora formicarum]GHO42282.1 hypothetical protein KSX_04450 [Ktedonospora formicarum]
MLEGLLWVQEYCDEAYCMTFAQGLGETELLRRFGGDLSQTRLAQFDNWDELEELRLFGDVILVGQCNGWAFAYEENGYRGISSEVLCPVSSGTVAVSVYHSVNADTFFCYGEDGTIAAGFDTLAPPFEDASPRVLALFHQAGIFLEDVESDNYDFVGAMFALAEAVGVRLSKEAFTGKPLLCTFIRNPFSDFIGDLLRQENNEQTVYRLLDILGDHWEAERFFSFLDENQQMEQVSPIAVHIVRSLLSVRITQQLLSMLSNKKQEMYAKISRVMHALISFEQRHDREEAGKQLLGLTAATDPDVRLHAALALEELKDQRAIEPLLALLSAPEPDIALQATLALGRLGDARAVDSLLHLQSLYPDKRAIIQLLGHLRASSAAELLFSLLAPHDQSNDPFDERIDFQRDVIDALERIEGKHIVKRLMPLLYPEPQTIMECSFQQALLAALARQGDASMVNPLLKLLNPHPKPMYPYDFQLRLLEALGNLGEIQVIEPLAQLLMPEFSTLSVYEQIFQEYLVKTLRQLGDARVELQAVELALQHELRSRN